MDPNNRNLKPIVENEIESKVENNPVQVANDPLMPKEVKEEATQVLDSNPYNDEANNNQIEKGVDKLSEDFDSIDDLYHYLNEEYPEDGSKGGSITREYEPINQASQAAPVGKQDTQIDNKADERSTITPEDGTKVQPDTTLVDVDMQSQQPDMSLYESAPELPYADNVIQEKPEEVVEDVVDYGLEDQNQYPDEIEIEDTKTEDIDPPAEDSLEKEAKETINIAPWLGSLKFAQSQVASPKSKEDKVPVDFSKLSKAGGSIIGNLGGFNVPSGSISSSSVSNSFSEMEELKNNNYAKSGGGSIPTTVNTLAAASHGGVKGSSSNAGITNNGGTVNSGATKAGGSLASKSMDLPSFTGHTDMSEGISIDSLKEATIKNLINEIMKMDDIVAIANEIDKKNLTYKGISIKKLPPEQLNELSKVVKGVY